MKWFQNLKISQKELSLIILMSIFLVIVGLTGYYLNVKETQRISYLYSDYLLSIQYLDEIRVNTRANEANIHRLITSNSHAEREKLLVNIKYRANIWNQSLSAYLKTPEEPYEAQRIPLLKNSTAKLNYLRNKSISLLQEGKRAEANKEFLALTLEIGKANILLADLANYNKNAAKAMNQSNLKFAKMANFIIWGTILLSLILSIPLGLLIARLISDPIDNLVARMKEVASGNLNPPYAKINTADEIGEMNNAFNHMADNLRCSFTKERKIREREEFLRRIILNSITTLQTNKVLQAVVTETGKLFNASRCYFVRYDKKNHSFLPIENFESYVSSLDLKKIAGLIFTYEDLEPFLQILLQQRESLIVMDIAKIDIPESTRKLFAEYNIKSFLAAPIFFREEPLGILMVDFDNTEKCAEKGDIDLLSSIANQSAAVIYQTRLFHEVQAGKDRSELIRKIISAIGGSLDLQEVLNTICREILNVFKADRSSIAKFPDKDELSHWSYTSQYKSGPDILGINDIDYSTISRQYLKKRIIEEGQDIITDDMEKSGLPDFFIDTNKKMNIKSYIAIPLDKWGVFTLSQVYNYRHWIEEEIQLFHTIADQAYIAIRQAELYSFTKQHAERQTILREILEKIRSTLDIYQIKNTIVNEVGRLLDADICFIRPFDIIRDEFLLVDEYSEYKSSPDVRGIREIEAEMGNKPEAISHEYIKKLFKENKQIFIPDAEALLAEDKKLDEPIKKLINTYGLKSAYSAPIFYADQFLGAFVIIYTKKPVKLNDEDVNLLRVLTAQTAIALNQAELYEFQKQTAEKESLLRNVIQTIRKTLDINEVKKLIINELGKSFDADIGFLSEYDPINKVFLPIDEYSGYLSSSHIALNYQSIIGDNIDQYKHYVNLLKQKKEIVINDIDEYLKTIQNQPDFNTAKNYVDKYNFKSGIGFPILYQDQLVGILIVQYTTRKHTFTEEELNFLRTIADQSGIALHQAKLYNKVQQNADREHLIRALNNEILTSDNMNDAIQNITAEIGKLFGLDRVVLRFFDPAQRAFSHVIGEYRKYDTILSALDMPFYPKEVNEYLAQQIIDKKEIFVITNLEDLKYPDSLRQTFNKINVKSTVAAPMIYKDTPIGVIFLTCTDKMRQWTDAELDLIRAVVQQLSIGLYLLNLNERLGKALGSERNIRSLILEARTFTNHDELFSHVMEQISDIFNVERIMHLHYRENHAIYIENEVLKSPHLEPLLCTTILSPDQTDENYAKIF